MKPKIAITMGDFNGIGPEVALKTASSAIIKNISIPVLIGSLEVFEYYAKLLKMKITLKEVYDIPKKNTNAIPVIPIRKYENPKIKIGKISEEAGRYAIEALIVAFLLNLRNEVDAIVTAPISKEAIILGGVRFEGQTEILANLSKTKEYEMLLVSDNLRVGLATIHTSISNVPKYLTGKLIRSKVNILNKTLKQDFRIKNPKIALLGLNPHAGESGYIGNEENKTIIPAIKYLKKGGVQIEGPFPADGFFGNQTYKKYDAILAMYHDQGLIPLKLLGFDKGVNFTAGIGIIRTSPDHGTAFDIAGKGLANIGSMREAVKLAVKIIKNRNLQSNNPSAG